MNVHCRGISVRTSQKTLYDSVLKKKTQQFNAYSMRTTCTVYNVKYGGAHTEDWALKGLIFFFNKLYTPEGRKFRPKFRALNEQ
jgi:hypothetical protein